ncbi:hypothetical protein PPACK8108_LOCUS23397 [Phakopsora pachyrhizi]|uniref:Uncharacterized protein n=1 Tax=Phakopsora pachyrhizi TaxID=170000 RepID=A0AAV0BP59_PHAPC|nr:hypothetical protein PPACK8108_LOCUS23397 [Phakopsora pachyrhizi]
MTAEMTQQPKQAILTFASNPSTSQAGPYSNSKNPLKTFNKESTGREESGEQEAEPGVELQDDLANQIQSVFLGDGLPPDIIIVFQSSSWSLLEHTNKSPLVN